MHILTVLTGSQHRDEAIHFAEQAANTTAGTLVLLAIAEDQSAAADLRLDLYATFSHTQRARLKVRIGECYQEVLAEITEGDYDLLVIGADPIDSNMAAPASQLARDALIPLAIVTSCPARWRTALICSQRSDLAAAQIGLEVSGGLQLAPTILHVSTQPSADSSGVPPPEYQMLPGNISEVRVRHGAVIDEIQAEMETGDFDFCIIGQHTSARAPKDAGPTLALPDFTQQIINKRFPVIIVVSHPAPARIVERSHPVLRSNIARMTRSMVVEALIYSILVVVYAVFAFRLLGSFLDRLFYENLPLYAAVALLLILGQGVLLEQLSSFLLDRLRLERFE